MGALLFALALAAQVPPGAQDQPLKNWKLERRETSARTGQLEIVAQIAGDEAVPRNLEKDKEVVDITGLRLRYFTDPRKRNEPSREVKVRSDKGHLDNGAGRVDLSGHVRIEEPPPDGDGTVLEAPEATIYFQRKFVCPAHGGKEDKPGKCPACRADLKPHTFTSIEAPKEFDLTKPDPATVLTGVGLTASDDIRSGRVERDGFLVTSGSPRELIPGSTAPETSKPALTEVRSKGPMTFLEEDAGITVTCQRDARIRRTEIDPAGRLETTTVEADAVELLARRGGGPKADPVPEKLAARGRVTMTGSDMLARADKLDWTGSEDLDLAELEGSVEVESQGSKIRSRAARIERLPGVSTFTEDVRATLVPGRGADAQPVVLRSQTLVTRAAPGGRDLGTIDAWDGVVLEGLSPGSAGGGTPGRAEADHFFWDQAEDHGFLDRRPFVRIVQEDSTLLAPRVILEGRSMFVLKGPKQVVMNQKDADGKPVRYTAASDGDIVVDSSGDRTVIRLQDRCVVRKEGEFHLFADRMDVTTTKEKQEMEALHAWGRVRARQLAAPQGDRAREGATMFGEWLTYVPKTATQPVKMTLTGSPVATVDSGRRVAQQEQLLLYEKVDPATGQPVQYQEMRGGRRGVRIMVDERPR